MKNSIYIVVILCFLSGCGPKQEKVERIMDDGVEVVINHLEPYKIKGEPSRLRFEEEFRIDFEEEEYLELGIKDLRSFEVDSEGNIFGIDRYRSAGYFLYKFDRNGKYIKRFGRRGQGPGEIQSLSTLTATKDGNIIVSQTPPFNSFFVDEDGRIIVMTYEAGENEDEYIHDIFNSDGVFIARKSIGISGELGRALNATIPYSKNNRYYRLRFKESGYMELIVYNMTWE